MTQDEINAQLEKYFTEWAHKTSESVEKTMQEFLQQFDLREKEIEHRENALKAQIDHYHEIEAGLKALTRAMILIEKLEKKLE